MARRRQRGDHDRHDDHDRDDKHRKPRRHRRGRKPRGPETKRIKAQTVVKGREPMAGTPDKQPQDQPNETAAFSTGPGEAVEYHYHRTGTYADDYAAQAELQQFESQERAPNIGGPGEIVTSGAANNPT